MSSTSEPLSFLEIEQRGTKPNPLQQVRSLNPDSSDHHMIDAYLVEYDKPWWKVPHLLKLNLLVILMTLPSTNNGYDGSMLNGLQSLSQWHNYMEDSVGRPLQGAILGVLSNGTVLGALFSCAISSIASDKFGRRAAIFLGLILLVVGAIVQGAANGYAMFFVGRFILGFGYNLGAVAAPSLISEIAYPSHRSVATACYNTCWYLGLVLASWITYGTRNIPNHNCWRIPSYVQAACPAIQLVTIFLLPESPRYFLSKGKEEQARATLLKWHAGGDEVRGGPLVEFELGEISRSLEMDRIYSQTTYMDFLKSPANKKRLFYCILVPFLMQMSGNGLVSYYLNLVLNSIGITETDRQLEINGCLMIYNWVTSVVLASLVKILKRRTMFVTSLSIMLVCYVIWTILSAINQQRNFEDASLGKGVLAMIFFYYFGYNMGLNGLPILYVSECLTYNLRAKGLNILHFTSNLATIYNGFVNPVAMHAIEWKYYIVYDCILAVELIVVYFTFIETAGYTLEEVCIAFGDDPDDIALGNIGLKTADQKTSVEHIENA